MKKTFLGILALELGLLAGCDSYETPGSHLQFYIESFSHPIRPGVSITQKGVSIKENGPGGEPVCQSADNKDRPCDQPPSGEISGVKCNGKPIELETGAINGGRITSKKYGKFRIVLTDDGSPMITLTKEQKKNLLRDYPPQ